MTAVGFVLLTIGAASCCVSLIRAWREMDRHRRRIEWIDGEIRRRREGLERGGAVKHLKMAIAAGDALTPEQAESAQALIEHALELRHERYVFSDAVAQILAAKTIEKAHELARRAQEEVYR